MEIGEFIASLDQMSVIVGTLVGLVMALVIGVPVGVVATRRTKRRTEAESEEKRAEQKAALEVMLSTMETKFSSLSSEALKSNQSSFFDIAEDKFKVQTQMHSTKLQEKEKLIDQQLNQMSETLKTVPTELDKNQKNVSEVIEKSTKSLEDSNKVHLTQLQNRSDSQTKEHFIKLEDKEVQINRTLGEMKDKLGKVEELIQEFEKSRESKLGALDDQLKNLTTTTNSLQKALADNQARGQWGERIAEQILDYLGLRKGVSYLQQAATPSGARPDFTFLLPNSLSIHMDCKFPIDNYLKYVEAGTEGERNEFTKNFLRNVESHVNAVTERGYIHNGTVDCVLLFIPNEQIYRFIHEEGSTVIDSAMRNKVILCSPLTLYIVLAVIRQASENFAIEQRSHEILALLSAIRQEWTKYTDMMDGMGKNFRTLQNKFDALTGTRTRQLDRQFARIESIASSSDNREDLPGVPALQEPGKPTNDLPF